ncbi:TIGR03750 family conjugal transfer protein [Avibacterium endocarditidis]
MKEHLSSETITFIPERLNKPPVVYRGMTISELVIVAISGFGIGFVIGVVIVLFLGNWVWIPTAIVPTLFLSIRFGGVYLSRLKRGKPDNWLERFFELKFSPSKFITTAQDWAIKRTR